MSPSVRRNLRDRYDGPAPREGTPHHHHTPHARSANPLQQSESRHVEHHQQAPPRGSPPRGERLASSHSLAPGLAGQIRASHLPQKRHAPFYGLIDGNYRRRAEHKGFPVTNAELEQMRVA